MLVTGLTATSEVPVMEKGKCAQLPPVGKHFPRARDERYERKGRSEAMGAGRVVIGTRR